MAVGLAATTLANKWLDTINNTAGAAGTSFAVAAGTFIELHTADPGAAGTTAVSSTTLRKTLAWSAASAGSKAITATLPSWTSWAGTNGEVVTHVAVFDAITAGNFLFSAALTASKTVNTGDTLNLTSLTFALTPIAA